MKAQWLSLGKLAGTSKDPTLLFAEFTATLKSAMTQETLRFVDNLFTEGTGRLSNLFGSRSSFVNAESSQNLWCVGRHSVPTCAKSRSIRPSERAS